MSIFDDLKGPADEKTSTYRAFDAYPTAYQATEFPLHGDKIRITGNNQAFFFVSAVKEEGKIVDVQANSAALEKLFTNIVTQGISAETRPLMRLQIDADVFENPTEFTKKYQALRAEAKGADRRRLLSKEARLIRTFVDKGHMYALAKKVLRADEMSHNDGMEPLDKMLDTLVGDFFDKNFRLEGVRTTEALPFATWEIKKQGEVFLAVQAYKNSTYMLDRPWQLGIGVDLAYLAINDHQGAAQILEATTFTRSLETVDLTYGAPESAVRTHKIRPPVLDA